MCENYLYLLVICDTRDDWAYTLDRNTDDLKTYKCETIYFEDK